MNIVSKKLKREILHFSNYLFYTISKKLTKNLILLCINKNSQFLVLGVLGILIPQKYPVIVLRAGGMAKWRERIPRQPKNSYA